MTIITIKKIPTIRSLKNNIYITPAKLTDRQLLARYGIILAAITAQRYKLLEYKFSEGYIIYNVEYYYKPLFEAELKTRNLWNEYSFFIELIKH